MTRCRHAIHQRRCPRCRRAVSVEQRELFPREVKATPRSVLAMVDTRGAYQRAVAWIVEHTPARSFRAEEQEQSTILIADLYGIEPGQVASDIAAARARGYITLQ